MNERLSKGTEYARRFARSGGKATTPAKQRASRENGKLGGRPKGSTKRKA